MGEDDPMEPAAKPRSSDKLNNAVQRLCNIWRSKLSVLRPYVPNDTPSDNIETGRESVRN